MIVDGIVTVLAGFFGIVGSLFGVFNVPSWWASVDSTLSQLASYAAGFGQWFPIAQGLQALTFVVAVVGIAFGIKVVRIVASFFTAGGGSAA